MAQTLIFSTLSGKAVYSDSAQAVISGNGLGMQDEFAEPEIESG